MLHLCGVQTSLPDLPLRRVITPYHIFMITTLSNHAALALSWNSITSKLNRIQLSAGAAAGKMAGLAIFLPDAALRLGIPLWQVPLKQ